MILRRELRPEARPPSLRFRPPNVHVPLWLLAVGWLFVLAWRLVRWLAVHPRSTVVLLVAGWLVLSNRVLPALVVAGIVAGVLCVWWAFWPGSMERRVLAPVQLALREWLTYRRDWQPAMLTAGLALREAWGGDLPTLRSVRSDAGRDVLRVRMLPGQTAERWQDAAPALAQTFGVRGIRVRRIPDRPQELALLVTARKNSRIRHVTELPPVPAQEQQPATGGAFPRRPREAA